MTSPWPTTRFATTRRTGKSTEERTTRDTTEPGRLRTRAGTAYSRIFASCAGKARFFRFSRDGGGDGGAMPFCEFSDAIDLLLVHGTDKNDARGSRERGFCWRVPAAQQERAGLGGR